jgi:hypothetical protein
MLKDSGLPNKFWTEAVATAAYLKNLSATRRHPGRTPYEIWTGSKPDVSHLRVFGCRAYKNVVHQKLDAKSTVCILTGYYPGDNYKLLDPTTGLVSSRDVIFDEGSMDRTNANDCEPSTGEHMESADVPILRRSARGLLMAES